MDGLWKCWCQLLGFANVFAGFFHEVFLRDPNSALLPFFPFLLVLLPDEQGTVGAPLPLTACGSVMWLLSTVNLVPIVWFCCVFMAVSMGCVAQYSRCKGLTMPLFLQSCWSLSGETYLHTCLVLFVAFGSYVQAAWQSDL